MLLGLWGACVPWYPWSCFPGRRRLWYTEETEETLPPPPTHTATTLRPGEGMLRTSVLNPCSCGPHTMASCLLPYQNIRAVCPS